MTHARASAELPRPDLPHEPSLTTQVLTAVTDGILVALLLIAIFGAVHYIRLYAGCPRSEWECIAAAWSALRRRRCHTHRRRTASGRRGQA